MESNGESSETKIKAQSLEEVNVETVDPVTTASKVEETPLPTTAAFQTSSASTTREESPSESAAAELRLEEPEVSVASASDFLVGSASQSGVSEKVVEDVLVTSVSETKISPSKPIAAHGSNEVYTASPEDIVPSTPAPTSRSDLEYATSTSPSPKPESTSETVTTSASPAPVDAKVAEQSAFASLAALSVPIKSALERVFEYTTMTPVQEQVLSRVPMTDNILVRAKTGTGKTLAFLIAALESILHKRRNAEAEDVEGRKAGKRNGGKVAVLIIEPTRELCVQTSTEAKKVLKFMDGWRSLIMVGGHSRQRQLDEFFNVVEGSRGSGGKGGNDVVITATPGRLLDYFENVPKFSKKFEDLDVLVLDEADRLLEMGFRDDIQQILKYLPKSRQTFLFSATVSDETKAIAREAMGTAPSSSSDVSTPAKSNPRDSKRARGNQTAVAEPNYRYIDCIPKNEVDTVQKIKQTYIVAPFASHLALLYDIIQRHRYANPFAKVIVFFPTTSMVKFYSRVFNRIKPMRPSNAPPSDEKVKFSLPVMEIHSKLSQRQRVMVSERFRRSGTSSTGDDGSGAAPGSVLFTSDVSARGVDYPGVTLVIQVGIPSNRDSYVHRIGRTGRAGKAGESILLLSPYEKNFIHNILGDLPLREDVRYNPQVSGRDPALLKEFKRVLTPPTPPTPADAGKPMYRPIVSREDATECYTQWLGFYITSRQLLGDVSKETIVRAAQDFATSVLGLEKAPMLSQRFLTHMGIQREMDRIGKKNAAVTVAVRAKEHGAVDVPPLFRRKEKGKDGRDRERKVRSSRYDRLF
ncbi:hypothetical protein HK102_012654 [Quaeritorhiza haematococci]|nr:hypothetical protein HK102_012654 [Quaeritorhiza haematococci]